MTDQTINLGALRTAAARAVVAARREGHGITAGHFASFKPEVVLALLDRIESLEAERAGIRERDEEVGTDEGWWIGGAWGDYGEAVVPLRILSYVIDGALDQKVTSIEPGFALTYAEQVARADRAEARLARVTDDSMAERVARDLMRDWECEVREGASGWHCNLHTTEAPDGVCRSAKFDAETVLATIRAVAEDEQEAER